MPKPHRKQPIAKTVQTTLRFGTTLRDALDKAAHRSGISRSALIQHVLTIYILTHSQAVVDLAVRLEALCVDDVML